MYEFNLRLLNRIIFIGVIYFEVEKQIFILDQNQFNGGCFSWLVMGTVLSFNTVLNITWIVQVLRCMSNVANTQEIPVRVTEIECSDHSPHQSKIKPKIARIALLRAQIYVVVYNFLSFCMNFSTFDSI